MESAWSKTFGMTVTVFHLEQQGKSIFCLVALMWLFFFLFLFFTWASERPKHHREMFNGSFERKLNLLVSFLSDQKDWRATSHLFPNLSNQNFEIAILFNIVQRFDIYGFGDNMTLNSPCGNDCMLYRYRTYWYYAYRQRRIGIARIGIAGTQILNSSYKRYCSYPRPSYKAHHQKVHNGTKNGTFGGVSQVEQLGLTELFRVTFNG